MKTEIEDNDNNNLTIPQVVNRLGMVFFLLIFNLGITVFVFLLMGMMLFSQILFIIFAMVLPISFAYYVAGNALEPIGRDYLYSELVNPVFTADGDNVKVKVAVKFIDNQTKATQVSQFELVLHKDINWKIVG